MYGTAAHWLLMPTHFERGNDDAARRPVNLALQEMGTFTPRLSNEKLA